mmetsp:Transcript_76010/g.211164  ORF Transcript_76010/g.211164 Transcript_76010/m.211164 type:complete len:379 (-) Transcript_76010:147-1283(-)
MALVRAASTGQLQPLQKTQRPNTSTGHSISSALAFARSTSRVALPALPSSRSGSPASPSSPSSPQRSRRMRGDSFNRRPGTNSFFPPRLDCALRQQCAWPDVAQMKPVTHLSLAGAGLEEADFGALPVVLQHTPNLKSLDVSHNCLGPSWTRVLAEAFRHTPDLNEFTACGCELEDVAGLDVAAKRLFVTNSMGCSLSTGLQKLRLGNNFLAAPGLRGLQAALKETPNLEVLELERNPIGHQGAFMVAPALIHVPSLAKLNMGECRIGPRGTVALAAGLCNASCLIELSLECNMIGVEGARELIQVLYNAKKLTSLDLGWNELGPEGMQVVAMAVHHNRKLTRLKLGGNGMDPSAERELMIGLRQIASGTLQPAQLAA